MDVSVISKENYSSFQTNYLGLEMLFINVQKYFALSFTKICGPPENNLL